MSAVATPTAANATNADGAKLLYPVGFGVCSHDNAVTCTTNENCSTLVSRQHLPYTGGGSHSSGLVNQIDALKASSWTPFSEAFYNAIGYFAYTAPTVSRTALRINDGTNAGQPVDFPADMNPSQFPCQQNYLLLISDGVSTADQRPSVMDPCRYIQDAGRSYRRRMHGLQGEQQPADPLLAGP